MLKPGSLIQIFAPLTSENRDGSSAGIASSDQPDQAEGVAVAGEQTVVVQEHEHRDEQHDAERGPQHLLGGVG